MFFAVLWWPENEKMAHKKKNKKICVFAVLWWPEKEKITHKKKELKNVCFCSVVEAREGNNGPP